MVRCEDYALDKFLPAARQEQGLKTLRNTYGNNNQYSSGWTPQVLQKMIAEDLREKYYNHYRNQADQIKAEQGKQFKDGRSILDKVRSAFSNSASVMLVSRIRYLLELAGLKDEFLTWSMSEHPENFMLGDGIITHLKPESWNELWGPGEEMEIKAKSFRMGTPFCEELARRSIEELSGGERSVPADDCVKPENPQLISTNKLEPIAQVLHKMKMDRAMPAALNRCIKCHQKGSLQIPFDDPEKLGEIQKLGSWRDRILKSISRNGNEPAKMPPGGSALTDKEVREIEDYLN